jgi:hypothetical protein
VADLRDLWTRDTLKLYASRWHYQWETRLERRTLESAGAIIANTPLAGERLRTWLRGEAGRRVHVIPSGFDSAEFVHSRWTGLLEPGGRIILA